MITTAQPPEEHSVAELKWWKSHAEALDKNWSTHHENVTRAIREPLLGCETSNIYGQSCQVESDSAVGEITEAIRRLRLAATAAQLDRQSRPCVSYYLLGFVIVAALATVGGFAMGVAYMTGGIGFGLPVG